MNTASPSPFKSLMYGLALTAIVLCATCEPAFAGKTSVSVNAPQTAAPGTEITIQVTATHDANNFIHHTDWLKVMADGKEIARWDYSWNKKPEGNVFTREITYTVTDSVEISAEGHCNIHGSAGPKTVKISVADTAN